MQMKQIFWTTANMTTHINYSAFFLGPGPSGLGGAGGRGAPKKPIPRAPPLPPPALRPRPPSAPRPRTLPPPPLPLSLPPALPTPRPPPPLPLRSKPLTLAGLALAQAQCHRPVTHSSLSLRTSLLPSLSTHLILCIKSAYEKLLKHDSVSLPSLFNLTLQSHLSSALKHIWWWAYRSSWWQRSASRSNSYHQAWRSWM